MDSLSRQLSYLVGALPLGPQSIQSKVTGLRSKSDFKWLFDLDVCSSALQFILIVFVNSDPQKKQVDTTCRLVSFAAGFFERRSIVSALDYAAHH